MIASLDSVYQPTTPAESPAVPANLPGQALPPDQIGRNVAHELNNVFTIIRGYADRLLIKHRDNPALRPELQLISDNARRAEKVVREASLAGRTPPTVTA